MVKPTYSRQCDQCSAREGAAKPDANSQTVGLFGPVEGGAVKLRPGNVVCVVGGETQYLCGSCANKAAGVWTADSPQRAREIRREREAAERGKRGR